MKLHDLYEEIESFVRSCERIFLYGAGMYGCFMYEFLKYHCRETEGFIETEGKEEHKNGLKVYRAESVSEILSDDDGIIITLSEKNQSGLDWSMIESWPCKVLKLEDWQLYEVRRFGTNYRQWDKAKDKEISKEIYREEKAELDRIEKARREELESLQSIYHFADWHVDTNNAYGYDAAGLIHEITYSIGHKARVYEVGCGLCNILGDSRLAGCSRVGIDRSSEVLEADRSLFGNKIEFRKGSFETIHGENIDVLVTVNFMNSIPREEIEKIYSELFGKNEIKYYMADEVTGNYLHHHKFIEMLPDTFELVSSLGPYPAYGGVRYIRLWRSNS